MSTTKELGEAWYGCQAEIKHLKAVIKLKETHILTLKEYILVYNPQKKRNEETTKRQEEERR